MADIDDLQIKIEADAKQATGSIKSLTEDLNKLSSSLKGITTEKSDKAMKAIASLANGAEKASNINVDRLNAVGEAIRGLTDDVDVGKINSTADALRSLAASVRELSGAGIKDISMSAFKDIATVPLGDTGMNKEEMQGLVDSLYQASQADEAFSQTAGSAMDALEKMSGVTHTASTSVEEVGNEAQSSAGKLSAFASSARATASADISSLFETTASAAKKLAKSFGQLALQNNTVSRFFKGIQSSVPSVNKAFEKLEKEIHRVTRLFTTMALRKAFNAVFSEMGTAVEHLALKFDDFNVKVSSLMSGLSQLGHSVAALASPLLDIFGPALNYIISLLNSAVNAINQFLAAFTGRTYISSKSVATDYAAGLEDAAGTAKSAADDLKATILGFDEINKLNDTTSRSGGGGSGAGSAETIEDCYEELAIAQEILDFVELIKESWANADFTEVGAILGDKLLEGLLGINWGPIKDTAERIGKSLGTLITGFVETEGLGAEIGITIGNAINVGVAGIAAFLDNTAWDSVGKFFAEGLNGVVAAVDWNALGTLVSSGVNSFTNTILGFIYNFNWKRAGSEIATAVNKALSTIDWNRAFQVVLDGLAGIIDAISGFLETLDWKEIAHTITHFIANLDFSGLASSLSEAVGAALSGLTALIGQIIVDAISGIGEYFSESIEESGGNIALGILNGIANVFQNIGTWIKEKILQPFLDGFKSVFGIASPATNEDLLEAAGYIGEGILNGIAKPFIDIAKWVNENLLQPIAKAISNFVAPIVEIVAEIKNDAKEWWSNVKVWWKKRVGKVEEFTTNVANGAKEWWSNVKSWWSGKVGKVEEFTTNVKDEATKWWNNAKNWWSGKVGSVQEFTTNVKNEASTWWSNVKSWWNEKVGSVSEFTTSVKNEASSWWSSVKSAWNSATKNEKVSISAKGVVESSSGWVKTLKSDIQKAVGTVSVKVSGSYSMQTMANGGAFYNGTWHSFSTKADGGILSNGYWKSIPKYASGTADAQGTVFLAGESGAEIVGNVNGRTEVLNESQIASAIYSAVYSAMTTVANGNNAGRTQTLTIQVPIDGKVVGQKSVEFINGQYAQGLDPLNL